MASAVESEADDLRTVEALRRGDEAAFTMLIHRHHPRC
jgi:hypothetical protein